MTTQEPDDPRAVALDPFMKEVAQVYATVYVGDQLKRLADMVEGGFNLTNVVRYTSGHSQTEHAGHVEPRRRS